MSTSSLSVWTRLALLLPLATCCLAADLVIRIPEATSRQDGIYRLYYRPEVGHPPANTTFRPQSVSDDVIKFSRGLPGTEYDFWLYYSNSSVSDWLTWTTSITTAPDPPSNLSVAVQSGRAVDVAWHPPEAGGFSGFRLKVLPLSEPQKSIRSIAIPENASTPFRLSDLTPGATYRVRLFTVYDSKESAAHISANFTTRPNAPGRLIVWFRNETTLLVLWQPPYPAGIYTHYKVSIDPPDAEASETYVARDGDPPRPSQAAFNGLVPGRAYNLSVETVSEDQTSAPTTAQYRTVPWRPYNVSFDEGMIGPDFFEVKWAEPGEVTEFDRYQVSVGIRRKAPQIIERGDPLKARFTENLKPGLTYKVSVKSVSGNVASRPATGNVTTRPLPILLYSVQTHTDPDTKNVSIAWEPNPESFQDQYKVSFHDPETFSDDSIGGSVVFVREPLLGLSQLQPGRNYSIAIQAVSQGIESIERTVFQATRPASPMIEEVTPTAGGLNLSWKSDVASKQEKYVLVAVRNDTAGSTTTETNQPRVTITGLYPGAEYEIKVFAVSHGLLSEPYISFMTVLPNPIRNLTVDRIQDNKIALSWRAPVDSLYTGYIVRYRSFGDNKPKPWTEITDITDNNYLLEELSSGERYEIEVNSVAHQVESTEPLSVIQTLSPAPVTNLMSMPREENITLEWTRPIGRVDAYRIEWYSVSNSDDLSTKELADDDVANEGIGRKMRVVIGDLHPGAQYAFEMTTGSHGMRSTKVTHSVRTTPLIKSEVSVINKPDVTDSFSIVYTATPLTSSLFDSYRFTVSDNSIPALEKAATDSDRRVTFYGLIPGRLYNVSVWTVSGAVASRPIVRQERLHPLPVTDINATQIGDRQIALVWTQPNGDFNAYEVQYLDEHDRVIANTTHANNIVVTGLMQFRNYTFTVITISGYMQPLARRSRPSTASFMTAESDPGISTVFEPGRDNKALFVGIILIPIDLILLVAVTVLVARSKQRSARDASGNGDNIPLAETRRPIKLHDFAEHYRTMSANSAFGFSEEYEELKYVGLDKPKLAADLPANRTKNRYANILPYDHSRVKLQPTDDEEGSDYINANYVSGLNSQREFVVTQGPLPSTLDDFWRMCWETNSRAIVMLTRCVEKGGDKCHHYWPYDTKPVDYGDIQVTVTSESHYPDWNISEFRLVRGDTVRSVSHFHFTTWPDFGVPEPPQTLVRFVRAFRARVDVDTRPIVVHCSAGVGRSGTFVGLDRVLQEAETNDSVDGFGVVHSMRRERVGMVQTERQYVCIHQCLLAVMEGREEEGEQQVLPLATGMGQIDEDQGLEDDDEGIAESEM